MALLQRLLVALLRVLVAGEHAAGDAMPSPASGGGGAAVNVEARYARVFCFGNSLTDTGNNPLLPATAGGPSTSPPYGMTFFHRPTGRSSDGRLLIDFIAADLLAGANFAVGGATALEPAVLESRGIVSVVPVSLSNETRWFKDTLQLLASTTNVNDYFLALASNHTVEQAAATLVPDIVGVIRSAVIDAIVAGARTVVVTGMIPLGCEPQLLALFPAASAADDDPDTGCDARFNELAEVHNRELIRMLRRLRRAFPAVAVHYADFYRPVTAIIASPAKYGFGDTPLAACCGGGGNAYNFDFAAFCTLPASTVCADPSKYVSWDGIHYTEAVNKFVARSMLRGVLPMPNPIPSPSLSIPLSSSHEHTGQETSRELATL
uniref:Esterase n=1 Tax=Oryza rufipogon TaxID=4529 RepID=A0A0E0QYM2_ORYRU